MSIFFKEPEKFVTKKSKNPAYVGMPAMKVQIGPIKAHYLNIVEPNLYKGKKNWSTNILLDEAGQAEVEDLLGRFAKAHIAEATKKGINKGDPDDPIVFQYKAKKVKGEGNVVIVTEDGEKIFKMESWRWAAEEDASKESPREPLACFITDEETGKPSRIPHTKAKWGPGSEIIVSAMAAVTYNEDAFEWVAKLVPSQVWCKKVVPWQSSGGGCDFGDEAPASDFDEDYSDTMARGGVATKDEEEPNW